MYYCRNYYFPFLACLCLQNALRSPTCQKFSCPIETSTLLPISISSIIFGGENQSCDVFAHLSCSAADAQLDAGVVWLTCRAALIPPSAPRGEGLDLRQDVPVQAGSHRCCGRGLGAPRQCAVSCHCHAEALGGPEEGQAQGERVLKAISPACPHSLPCAGAVLGHLKCVLMPDTGHTPSYHLPVLFLLTLHLLKALFSEVLCEGEVQVGLEWQHYLLGMVTHLGL